MLKKRRSGKKDVKKTLKKSSKSSEGLVISSDEKKTGSCSIELSKEDVKKILDLFKPIPTIENSICFKAIGSDLIVGHNVESVMSAVFIKGVVEDLKDPFVFLINRKVVTEIHDLMGDTISLKLKEGSLNLDLGATKLQMLTLEDVEVPNITIDTVSKVETSSKIDPDFLEGSLNRALVIKNKALGVIEGYSTIGEKIVTGSATSFTEVESGVKGVEVSVVPEFLTYVKNIARTASKWVKIYKSEDYVIAVNDNGLIHQGSLLSEDFPINIKALEKQGDLQAEFLIDKRALLTSLKKLNIVLVGTKDPTLHIEATKGTLELEVKSLNGKKSKDKVSLTSLKGKAKTITLHLNFLKEALSVLETNTNFKIYDRFIVLEDQHQRIVLAIQQDS